MTLRKVTLSAIYCDKCGVQYKYGFGLDASSQQLRMAAKAEGWVREYDKGNGIKGDYCPKHVTVKEP